MVIAVVLAAGASQRMGEPKLLLTLAGEPLVRRTVRRVAEAGFDEVVVVIGPDPERVSKALDGLACRIVHNTSYATGMGSSFRAAIEAVSASEAAMFALADQPFVTTAQYRRVLDAYRLGLAPIVSVRYGTVTAPPHLFSREFFPELAALDHGARPVLARHATRTAVLEFPPDQLLDVDTPEDYERALARAAGEAAADTDADP